MCDYSLHDVASRPAVVGDKLITTRFRGTCTNGFSAVDEPMVAVCLRPGTELSFEAEVERQHPFSRLVPGFRFGKLGNTTARFRQINLNVQHAHHDALELSDGKIVLVTDLREGQVARVLQLPVDAQSGQREERPVAARDADVQPDTPAINRASV